MKRTFPGDEHTLPEAKRFKKNHHEAVRLETLSNIGALRLLESSKIETLKFHAFTDINHTSNSAQEKYNEQLWSILKPGKSSQFINKQQDSALLEAEYGTTLFRQNQFLRLNKYKSNGFVYKDFEYAFDAPGYISNFYHQDIDWSMSNLFGISMGDSVYTRCMTTGRITKAYVEHEMLITALSFCKSDSGKSFAACGCQTVSVVDVETCNIVRKFDKPQHDIVTAMDWNASHPIVLLGSRLGVLCFVDVRTPNGTVALKRNAHNNKGLCGARIHNDGLRVVSGCDFGTVRLWDLRKLQNNAPFIHELSGHVGSVKAIDWCPWNSNILATGGGTEDNNVIIWDVNKLSAIAKYNTTSQITGIKWSAYTKQFVISQGFGGNRASVYEFNTQTNQIRLNHAFDPVPGRAINISSLNPDSSRFAIACSSETAYIYKAFPERAPIVTGKRSVDTLRSNEAVSRIMTIR